MITKRQIRQFAAVLLLLVFSIGNTPKTAFHFLFADHNDEVAYVIEGEHIKSPVKTCDILDLVCSLPYHSSGTTLFIRSNTIGELKPVRPENSSPFTIHGELSLRGPPAARPA